MSEQAPTTHTTAAPAPQGALLSAERLAEIRALQAEWDGYSATRAWRAPHLTPHLATTYAGELLRHLDTQAAALAAREAEVAKWKLKSELDSGFILAALKNRQQQDVNYVAEATRLLKQCRRPDLARAVEFEMSQHGSALTYLALVQRMVAAREQQVAALLAEVAAGTQAVDADCQSAHNDPKFGEFLRGMNAGYDRLTRWVRWKAHELGLAWPLPAAEFGYGYTNADGSAWPAPTASPVPLVAGQAGEREGWQVPGMPQAKCHGCGLPSHVARCRAEDCPMKPSAQVYPIDELKKWDGDTTGYGV